MKVSILVFAVGGDQIYTLVPRAVLAAIQNCSPGTYIISDALEKELRPFFDQDYGPTLKAVDRVVELTSGSWNNDLALHMSVICDGFSTLSAILNELALKGYELDGEYFGYIY